MSFNPFALARKQRKMELLAYISNPNPLSVRDKGIPTRKLVGAFTFRWGIQSRVIHSYLVELQDAGLINIAEDYVRLAVGEDMMDEIYGGRDQWKKPQERPKK